MAWPTVTISKTAVDADSDLLVNARPQLEDDIDKTNDMIEARNVASGVCGLDANVLVPEAYLRQIITPVVKTANYSVVATDAQRSFILENNITITVDDTLFSTGTWMYFKNGNLDSGNEEVTITVTGGATIEFDTSVTLRAGDAITIIRGSSRWYAMEPHRGSVSGTGYIPRRFAYFYDEIIDSSNLWTTVATDVTEDTWESVGPTGSGADNIWTALDDLPSVQGFIDVNCEASASGVTAAGEVEMSLYAREYGSSASTSDKAIAQFVGYSTNTVLPAVTGHRVIPVDSQGRFEIRWEKNANNTAVFRLALNGFWT